MGAIISAIAGIGELVAATGFTADALIAGEAAAALEAQISALVTIEGLTTAEEMYSDECLQGGKACSSVRLRHYV